MKYRTLESVTLGPGALLELSPQQVSRRRHALKEVGKGKFEALQHVNFKVGEVIGMSGMLPKSLADVMEPLRSADSERAAA